MFIWKLLGSIYYMWSILSNRSSEWTYVRKQHLTKQPYCMACGSSKKLQVHHIEPFHVNPDRELDPTNLITLCSNCHLVFGHLMDYTSWNKDVENDTKVYYLKVQNRPYKVAAQNVQTIYSMLSLFFAKLNSLFWYNRP